MEWEQKVKMVQLGNKSFTTNYGRFEFYNYVMEQLPNFDGQAWDMFSNIVQIIPSEMEMESHILFWKEVYKYIKDVDCNDEKFGFRSGIRIALIQTVCEEILKEKTS